MSASTRDPADDQSIQQSTNSIHNAPSLSNTSAPATPVSTNKTINTSAPQSTNAPTTPSSGNHLATQLEHYWPFSSVCQFFEIFGSVLGESFRFYPEQLIDGLKCSNHVETETRAMPTTLGGHSAHRCRCHATSGCEHITHLHMSLFKAAGLKSVTGENWRKIFDHELNQREDDWPLLWAIQRTHPYTEESSDELYNSTNQSVYDHDDGTARHPLINYHYYALPACYKVALLHIHTCWILNDDRVREIVTAMGTHVPTPFGEDDDGNRYYLYTHSEWTSGRVHFYRETKGHPVSRICPAEWSFELLASNREQLEIAATAFATHTSSHAIELLRKITHEIIPQLDREAKLAERRIRRMTRVENEIDWSAFAFNDFGTRTRRARKEVSYKEVEENDIPAVESAPRGGRSRGRASRDEDDYVDDQVSEEDEEDIPLHFRTAPPRQTRYETRGGAQTSYSEHDSQDEEEPVDQPPNQSTDLQEEDDDEVMNDDEPINQSTIDSDSDASSSHYADQSADQSSAMQTEVSV